MYTSVYVDGNEIASPFIEFTIEAPAVDPCSTATLTIQTHPALVPAVIDYKVGDTLLTYEMDVLAHI